MLTPISFGWFSC